MTDAQKTSKIIDENAIRAESKREEEKSKRLKTLDELTAEAQRLGLYD
jgi:hypothetical protein